MRDILCNHDASESFVVLERSQAFPDQGAVSNFTTGHGYGLWRGLIVGLGFPYETVHPRTWKGAMSLDGDKGKSFLLAKQLFPSVADSFKKPKGRVDSLDGRAEALLLAEWARRKNAICT
jgi:crossover junction endodeoxyribonuclease RuvC